MQDCFAFKSFKKDKNLKILNGNTCMVLYAWYVCVDNIFSIKNINLSF